MRKVAKPALKLIEMKITYSFPPLRVFHQFSIKNKQWNQPFDSLLSIL